MHRFTYILPCADLASPCRAIAARQLRAYDHVLDPWDVHAPMAVAGCLTGVRGAVRAPRQAATRPCSSFAAVVEDRFPRALRLGAVGGEGATQRGEFGLTRVGMRPPLAAGR